MSQIGRKEVLIPEKVSVNIESGFITVKGPLGELSLHFKDGISITMKDDSLAVARKDDSKTNKELHGLTRALVANMIEGVYSGYSKELSLVGVGYTADAKGPYLLLNLGYSHPIYFEKPDTITFETPNNTTIIVKGIDKQEVGEVSAKIRSLRKPEPFKGKGVKYSDEHIRRKAGKTVGA